ncbi:MAG: hypothetical protein KJ597_00590 [Nanoarchaeota archaeon]|nr:hypothetical protein [Nanoarchaeota archaeon]MBU1622050.1 hypothetical protein [Nanoarchaeota archaeon]
MVKLISKVSKGSRMDQVYLPKLRPPGFSVGDAVEIIPSKRKKSRFYTYRVSSLETIKSLIKDELFDYFEQIDNVLITGSFLEQGFKFNDVDVVLVDNVKVDKNWEHYFQKKLGINVHFTNLNRKSLRRGLKTDPLFQMMMSKYIAKKREIFQFKNEFNYKLLDLHLLKSKTLLNSFNDLTGKEKYNLTRNMIAIQLFLKKEKLTGNLVDKEIEKLFGKGTVHKLKENMIKKSVFLRKFKYRYEQTFEKIMTGLKNGTKPQ